MPSLAYLRMYQHRDICAAPSEVKGVGSWRVLIRHSLRKLLESWKHLPCPH